MPAAAEAGKLFDFNLTLPISECSGWLRWALQSQARHGAAVVHKRCNTKGAAGNSHEGLCWAGSS
jgi:hypothetical protein